jgi:hypothetical protein
MPGTGPEERAARLVSIMSDKYFFSSAVNRARDAALKHQTRGNKHARRQPIRSTFDRKTPMNKLLSLLIAGLFAATTAIAADAPKAGAAPADKPAAEAAKPATDAPAKKSTKKSSKKSTKKSTAPAAEKPAQ